MSSAIRPYTIKEKNARKAYLQRLPWEIIPSIVSGPRPWQMVPRPLDGSDGDDAVGLVRDDGRFGAGGRRRASTRRRILFGDPGAELRVGDCEQHGADEQADQPEADQAADHAGHDEQQRQVGAAADQDRPDHVVEQTDDYRPHEQSDRRRRSAVDVEPADSRQHWQPGSKLRDA